MVLTFVENRDPRLAHRAWGRKLVARSIDTKGQIVLFHPHDAATELDPYPDLAEGDAKGKDIPIEGHSSP